MNDILWTPTKERADASTMAEFERFLNEKRGLTFDDYNAMWDWSVTDLDGFWSAIWEYFDVKASAPYTSVMAKRQMPGAEWCPGAMLNFTDQIMKHVDSQPEGDALIVQSETFGRKRLSWTELRDQVASVAAHLRDMGVTKGDRVVAVLPNTETAMIAFFATASIGAIWSLCAPDMGHVAILDRFNASRCPSWAICPKGIWRGTACWTATRPMRAPKSPSTIRCGSSIPPVPPAIPSRLCTGMAGSFWNPRNNPCTMISGAAGGIAG